MGGVQGRGVAMAVVCGGRGHEHDGGAGCGRGVHRGRLGEGEAARGGDGCEDELAAALGNETGEARSGIGGAELDDAVVAAELLPGVGEDASAGVGLVPSVFGAIGTCLALCDGTLGGLGEGVSVVGARWRRRGGDGIRFEEAFGLFEAFSSGSELLAEGVGVAVAGGEELGELGVGLGGRGAVGGRGRHGGECGGLWGDRHGTRRGRGRRRGQESGGGFYGLRCGSCVDKNKVSGAPADVWDLLRPAFLPRDMQRWRGWHDFASNMEGVGLAAPILQSAQSQPPDA